MNLRTGLFVTATLLAFAAAVLVPAVPQPLDYHHFADDRTMLGVANFLDVVSNLAFLVAGAMGLHVTLRTRTAFETGAERVPYAVFFAGLVLTAAGSGWYHLRPDNESLFWDRLPMTIAFMALVSAQVTERLSLRAGLVLLAPLLALGIVSVLHWRATERAGVGNVLPYAVLQGYTIVAVLMLALLHRSRYTHGGAILWVFAAYLLAKLLEHFDHELYDLFGLVSGHTLKHLAAAASGFVVVWMLRVRAPRGRAPPDRTAIVR